ncbi:hypothetical protein DFQ28_006348 [Apophysomyces sp. BC1034]|nr:hypothetical protein DFQ28_006348 [Apophysomyces sp. BC1034]
MASWLVESVDDPQLCDSVNNLISLHPESQTVVQALVAYYNAKLTADEPQRKKRRIDQTTENIVATITDLSFQQPTRKKYNLVITTSHLQITLPNAEVIESEWPLKDFKLGVYVPTPDKPSYTFALFRNQTSEEAIVFTLQDKGSATIRRPGQPDEIVNSDKHQVIARILTDSARIQFTTPSAQVFRSTGVSATTGKPQDRCHVNVYLKTKEAGIAVSGVTQRTFDLAIKLEKAKIPLGSMSKQAADEEEEITLQFSMIEQSEYEGINAYINKTGINDKSMDEELKAPEPKSRKEETDEEGNPILGDERNTKAMEEDEEHDEDFEPSDDDEDPLEYDTDASGDGDVDEQQTHEDMEDDGSQSETVDDTIGLISDSD